MPILPADSTWTFHLQFLISVRDREINLNAIILTSVILISISQKIPKSGLFIRKISPKVPGTECKIYAVGETTENRNH
ncbi:hypothetical protein MSSIT_3130 [Methanosarcina siciliae T4/M]|uniref:Uncharacterized protein n=2 Tax=Methanosarcina siciliae TaxID=38027 RepID=A0A0E3PGB1_9EURY|nr:hypothetical protein MSSIT_3130 [Methanosarcina siciliae T4/M]AKB33762.1 hypothetical protein MSSIH_3072 [Methanosarcina siciliae HI350]